MLKYNMNSPFNKVLLYKNTKTLKTPENLIICESEEQYNQLLANDTEGLVELIGGESQQIKPILDIDQYLVDIDINALIADINIIFPNKEIKYNRRPPRPYNGRMKYSYRLYIQDVRISYINLKQLLNDNDLFNKYSGIDKGLYISNRILYTPNTKYKYDQKFNKYYEVPQLKLMNDAELFECCASYIEETFEDWDLKFPPIENKKNYKERDDFKYDSNLVDTDEKPYDGKLNFNEIITKLSKKRATEYNDWFYIGVSLINLYYRKIISRGQIYDLFDLFSSKADNYDADGVIKNIDINISRFNGVGYGIKYLLNCLKTDNIDYYNEITKKDFIISSSNDDIGASEIVIDFYKDILVICDGILYVKDNDVWISNEKTVDNILINLISKLDIKFYGADGKRKYSYNRSIKHIKDCIGCIKANETIINNRFYNDMIKNNKYYLPFNDGIYSFKDKKLYPYNEATNEATNELSNINFTYKIDRNFPKFNKKDYDDMMNTLIIPIFPNDEEREYNAHIKARALAGCYRDKKWYTFTGSRNSGKGTETEILISAFKKFVMPFNAKCLVNNKFSNPDSAKGLSWIIDKKDARIIISNEIDCEENTVLNGAFIKTLASGGDVMEARKNNKDEITFTPQFTMILCLNQLHSISPEDAIQNMEEFNYKSKFVDEEELIDGLPFLKLKNENIKSFCQEERIIDAYTLYILNAFTDPRMKTPEIIKLSTEINNVDSKISIENFIIQKYKNSRDENNRIHTQDIHTMLLENNYKIKLIEVGKLMNRIGIGKYNRLCNINGERKGGFEYIISI